MKSAESRASALDSRSANFDRRAIPADAAESRFVLADGHELRRIDWARRPALRGSLLFLPGRGDCYEKYLETLSHWARQGWHVTSADWRGQAGSGRLGNDAVTGHIDDFATWVSDLAQLWAAWKAATPAPHVLIGHSMGGHLVLRAAIEGQVDPEAIVLSAPMLGVAGLPLPLAILHGAARIMAGIGDRRRAAWKWSEKPGAVPADRGGLLTHDRDRYADELWWRDRRPELVMGPGSWGWMERAFASMRDLMRAGALEKVQLPVLLIGAKRDRLVSYAAIEEAARRLPQGELLTFGEEARHEVLRENDKVRDRALIAIDAFLLRHAPATRA